MIAFTCGYNLSNLTCNTQGSLNNLKSYPISSKFIALINIQWHQLCNNKLFMIQYCIYNAVIKVSVNFEEKYLVLQRLIAALHCIKCALRETKLPLRRYYRGYKTTRQDYDRTLWHQVWTTSRSAGRTVDPGQCYMISYCRGLRPHSSTSAYIV